MIGFKIGPEDQLKPTHTMLENNYPPGTWSAALNILKSKGLELGSAIDIGSADGHFSAFMFELGFFRQVDMLNVDANSIYSPSLKKLQRAIGAKFAVCAVGETCGRVAFTRGVHPYWGSVRPPDDPYWLTVNNLSSDQASVEVRTIDSLVSEHRLRAPHLIKLDIQGGEVAALKGAAQTLEKTDVVIVETMIEDFDILYRTLSDRGFQLFDLTYIHRRHDQSLSWFYPVFLHARRANLIDHAIWRASENTAIVSAVEQHRQKLIQEIDDSLARLRSAGLIPE